ncbi:MAG: NAD(P)H-dependent oxidoreductase [Caldilineales bacterium]
MNATILNGGHVGDRFTDHVQNLLVAELSNSGDVAAWTLRDEKIAYCLGCFDCWTRTPGLCRIDDAGRDVAASIIASDLVIFLTPVTFGGYSSQIKKAVDRSICLISPFFTRIGGEVHHQPRYDRYPAMLAIGILPERSPDQEAIFTRLVERHAINLHAPQHATVVITHSQDEHALRATLRAALPIQETAPQWTPQKTHFC